MPEFIDRGRKPKGRGRGAAKAATPKKGADKGKGGADKGKGKGKEGKHEAVAPSRSRSKESSASSGVSSTTSSFPYGWSTEKADVAELLSWARAEGRSEDEQHESAGVGFCCVQKVLRSECYSVLCQAQIRTS